MPKTYDFSYSVPPFTSSFKTTPLITCGDCPGSVVRYRIILRLNGFINMISA